MTAKTTCFCVGNKINFYLLNKKNTLVFIKMEMYPVKNIYLDENNAMQLFSSSTG